MNSLEFTMIRLLVTGGRDVSDEDFVFETLSALFEELDDPEVTVVHGAARGADSLAGQWARLMGEDFRVYEEAWPAQWDEHGKAAGPIRNQEMVDRGADLVVAFYKNGAENRGTSHCVKAAKRAGLDVREYWTD